MPPECKQRVMKKRIITLGIVAACVAIAFLFLSPARIAYASAASIPDSGVQQNHLGPAIENSVYNAINEKGSVSVLIRLKPAQAAGTGLKTAAFYVQSSQNENQSGIEKNISKEIGIRNVAFSKYGFIYANLTYAQLQKIQSNPNIESISTETIYHIDSEAPTAQINVTAVQNIAFDGKNLNGTGQTVCIIDTGVNYTLPDLGGCYGNNNASSPCKVIGGYNFINNTADPMDDNGHGTHVAGIIAASGGITGVAPGAKIIAIKACDASGSCPEADIQSGINWCVDNASKFNISVISISLGSGDYSGYCNSDPLAPNVNAAVAENISVVAASGNDGNTTAMSSPACIQNVTAVGDTYVQSYPSETFNWLASNGSILCSDVNPAANQIVCHSNRDSVLELLAPGAMINSTEYSGAPVCSSGATCSGNYAELGGTSMAAPHVSGAIAVLKQYLALNNESLSPSSAQSALNSTGTPIYDSSSGLTFRLINVFSALLSLDTQSPSVTLDFPANSSITPDKNQTFQCTSSDLELKNATIDIWNSAGSLYYNATENITGQDNSTQFSVALLNYTTYAWNCFSEDGNNNLGSSSQNFTITLSPGVIYLSPANETYTNQNQTNFTCNSTYIFPGEGLSNVTFQLFNSSSYLIYNKTESISGSANLTSYNYTFTNQDAYNWGCYAYTNESNLTESGNYSLVYDTTPPEISLASPGNNSALQGGTQTVDFQYNATDNFATKNCTLYINNASAAESSGIVQGINSFYAQVSPGTYSWNVECYDKAGNFNSSSTGEFSVENVQTSSSSGYSGYAVYSSPAPAPLPAQNPEANNTPQNNITAGYYVNIPSGSEHLFTLPSGNHSIKADILTPYTANITVMSNPVNFVLTIGQSKYLNLSSPDYYDLLVTLNSIQGKNANITLRELTSGNRIFRTSSPAESGQTSPYVNYFYNELKTPKAREIISIVAAALVFLIIIFLVPWKKKGPENKNTWKESEKFQNKKRKNQKRKKK